MDYTPHAQVNGLGQSWALSGPLGHDSPLRRWQCLYGLSFRFCLQSPLGKDPGTKDSGPWGDWKPPLGTGSLPLVLSTPSLEAGLYLLHFSFNLSISQSPGLVKSQIPLTSILWHLTPDALDVNISTQAQVLSSTLLSLPNWIVEPPVSNLI